MSTRVESIFRCSFLSRVSASGVVWRRTLKRGGMLCLSWTISMGIGLPGLYICTAVDMYLGCASLFVNMRQIH